MLGTRDGTPARGTDPRGDCCLETEADREEQEEDRRRTHARYAADARADWTRVVDLHRQPALAYGDANICGHRFVYGWSDDRSEAVTVRALRDLAATARTFDLAEQGSAFDVALHLTERPVRSWPFCSDVGGAVEETWRATKGSVTLEVSPRVADGRERTRYSATIRVVGAEFVNGDGKRVQQVHPIVLTVIAR